MSFYVYILYSPVAQPFYKGQTNDLVKRLARHNAGKEAYTSKQRPWHIVWYCTKPTRAQAIALENKLKNLSVERIRLFINRYPIEESIKGLDY